MKKIYLGIFLSLLVVLSEVAFASSKCPYNNNNVNLCYCGDGTYERYTTKKGYMEARQDPDSCCNYDARRKRAQYLASLSAIKPIINNYGARTTPTVQKPVLDVPEQPTKQDMIMVGSDVLMGFFYKGFSVVRAIPV